MSAASTAEAWRLIDKEGVRRCVVAAVDTLVRSRRPRPISIGDGFLRKRIPTGSHPVRPSRCLGRAGRRAIRLEILGLGFAREPATINSDDLLRGEGLTGRHPARARPGRLK